MSSKFCSNCGKQLAPDAQFCTDCGHKQKSSDQSTMTNQTVSTPNQTSQNNPYYPNQPTGPPQYPSGQPHQQMPPQYQHTQTFQGYAPNPNQGYMGYGYQRNQYIRPPGYVFTKTIGERIVGTFRRDIHVIEEIEEREDLLDEANKLLIACFSFVAILQILYSITFNVLNLGAEILYTLLSRFVGGYTFIYLIAVVGQAVGGSETQTNRKEIVRVTSYAYVARVLDETLFFLSEVISNPFLSLLWLIAFVYAIVVFITVVSRALDRGIGTAIITLIIAGIGYLTVNYAFFTILGL